MQDFTTRTIRDIAVELPQTTRVFESFKIDYCCGGRKNFLDACQNAGADPDKVLEGLSTVLNADATPDQNGRNTEPLTELVDYILDKHHVFTHYEISNLPALMDKVARVHGDHHPELLELRDQLTKLADDLTMHMYKEENVLFPFIKDLDTAVTTGTTVSRPPFGTVQHPIRMMMAEHDTDGDILKEMRRLSKDYTIPDGACPSYAGLYTRLEALEHDLHEHIHLENNVLFPRAAELEAAAF
jgi:regulator of cell morphogenesis and NO signaling